MKTDDKHVSIAKRLFQILQPAEEGDTVSKIFDIVLVVLILISSINAFAMTFDIGALGLLAMNIEEDVIVVFFSIELILRLATAGYLYPEYSKPKAALKYLCSGSGIIDLLSVVPFWLSAFIPFNTVAIRLLRLFRMFRVFKLGSYMEGLSRIGKTIKLKQHELISSVLVIAVLMFVAAIMMYSVENEAQPDAFRNAADGLWWSLCTLTTVGYGDVYPITAIGKLLGAIIALLGIGIVAIPSGIIASGFSELSQGDRTDDKKAYCPYCGHKVE